eukprot:9489454-Pyramimonas_sp.AAC.1
MRADVLAHAARCGPPVYRGRIGPYAPQLKQVFRACAIRAGCDGGALLRRCESRMLDRCSTCIECSEAIAQPRYYLGGGV